MNPPSPLLLGMDGGGTVTKVWLTDLEGRCLGQGVSGPSNIKAVGANSARTALDLSVLAAFQDAGIDVSPVEVACLGLAGFDRPEDKDWLRHWASETAWARRLVLVNDGDLVVAAGTPGGWGVGLIAGTGSIAIGRSPEGRKARSGGWGFIFGDEGSAYAIAVAALRRIARQVDKRLPVNQPDTLTRLVCASLGIKDTTGLIAAVYGQGFDRATIAKIAPAVVEAANEDISIVRSIIEPAGFDLAEMVMAVARQLGWTEGPLPLAMAGGFLLNCASMRGVVLDCLATAGYEVESRPVSNPVEGAIVLAIRELAS